MMDETKKESNLATSICGYCSKPFGKQAELRIKQEGEYRKQCMLCEDVMTLHLGCAKALFHSFYDKNN